jgi:hypothetical protein
MVDIIKQRFEAAKITCIELTQKLRTRNDAVDLFNKIKDDKYKSIGFIVDIENIPNKKTKELVYLSLKRTSPNLSNHKFFFVCYNGKSKTINKDKVNIISLDQLIKLDINEFFECIICYENKDEAYACPTCTTRICRSCFDKLINKARDDLHNSNESYKDVPCPSCRTKLAIVCNKK